MASNAPSSPTPNPVPTPPPRTAPPAALFIDGRHQLGAFDAPVPRLNLADAVTATGVRGQLARRWRDLRTKEWQAFQLGTDDWFVLGAVYDAKVLGIVMIIAVHTPSGEIRRWIDKVPSPRVSVARGLVGTRSQGASRRGSLTITNEARALTVDARHDGDARRAPLALHGTGFVEPGHHLAVCLPFAGERVLYTNKCLMPFEGELRIAGETVAFDAASSFLILDDHHGEYPSPQIYDWVTAAEHRDGALVGFNLTDNQALDPAVHNENLLWRDGTVHRLPPVRFTRPDGVEGPWHVADAHGSVAVTFTPQVRSTLHVGPRRFLAEYHAPYGSFAGTIDVDGEVTSVAGWFGMGERKHIRV